MLDPSMLPGFLLAVLLITLAPGPDHAYIAAAALDRGGRAGLVSAVGMALGMCVHVVAAALGVAALLRSAPQALDLVRVCGAAYLGWLAVTTFRSARRTGVGQVRFADGQVLTRALLTNVTNPKVILFFAAFLPQFADPGRGAMAPQMLALGGIFLLVGFLVDSVVGLSFGRLGEVLAPDGRAATALSVSAGITFAVLAVLLLADLART